MISTEELYSLYVSCGYRVTTDSRAVRGGEIFFALKGENFDGNAYAAKALESGAAYAVVNEGSDCFAVTAGIPSQKLIMVEDPFTELQKLAVFHRERLGVPVIGLTGTNGKTTTKELMAAVLRAKYRVTATEGNLNNDIGVPLSLLKMTPETQIAVIEMGASHPGDIAKLVVVSRPDYGLITNVGKAHLLGFGSFEGVKATKGELYNWLGKREGAVLFLNQDDPDLVEMARKEACHVWGYGLKYQGVTLLPSTSGNPFLGLRLSDGTEIHTRLVGAYNATNVMAALAVGEYFGVPRSEAVAALEGYVPSNQRSQMQRTESNTLVIDAYNANPSSMGVALDNLFGMDATRKVALLGDMRELGEDSVAEHVALVKRLASSGVKFCLVGEEFRKAVLECIADGTLKGVDTAVAQALPAGLNNPMNARVEAGETVPLNTSIPESSAFLGWFPESSDLALHLGVHPLKNCVILVKGSRGIRMEKVLPVL
ncbi:MAG: UDP-N-acetylmuramoyl-tripeptide--D-alanyl-D-alanine ligase [Bacteroidales bacterium]|nr:UDP-N-acetylmuramoyl-tripeptide--D-alanyl-D-alanine ligase [Bacteroidales bacterium]